MAVNSRILQRLNTTGRGIKGPVSSTVTRASVPERKLRKQPYNDTPLYPKRYRYRSIYAGTDKPHDEPHQLLRKSKSRKQKPYDVFAFQYGQKILDVFGLKRIPADEIILTPNILKQQ